MSVGYLSDAASILASRCSLSVVPSSYNLGTLPQMRAEKQEPPMGQLILDHNVSVKIKRKPSQ
jgi:hypothetical protein